MGITAGSREVPGRNACDRRHTYSIIIIIIIIREIGLEASADKTKYMVMSRDQNAGRITECGD